MPYLATTLRPQGLLLSGYSLLDNAALPNSIADDQRPAAERRRPRPTARSTPSSRPARKRTPGDRQRQRLHLPVESVTFSDQLIGARLRWHGYMEGMVDETGQPDSCVQPEPNAADMPAPGGYAAKLNPFVYFHSLLDLGDCTENDVPLSELEGDLKKIETTPNFNYIRPTSATPALSGQCPAGAPDGAAAADAFLAAWVPKILASPAYKKDGLLIVNFGQVNPPPRSTRPSPHPRTRSKSAPWCSRASSPPAPPTPSPTTPTRCCAPSRTSSTSLPSALPAARR